MLLCISFILLYTCAYSWLHIVLRLANMHGFLHMCINMLMCFVCHFVSMFVCEYFAWPYTYQEFHYRRRGSDVCLPCDCYPVGSFTRSCDPESGQCQCRPGVISRQCNMCDNPFAEVTQTGCEGGTE